MGTLVALAPGPRNSFVQYEFLTKQTALCNMNSQQTALCNMNSQNTLVITHYPHWNTLMCPIIPKWLYPFWNYWTLGHLSTENQIFEKKLDFDHTGDLGHLGV